MSHIEENIVSNTLDDDLMSENSNDYQPETLPLTVLFKFIKSFSGERTELNTFITNVNSAFSLAQPNQKPSLFLYVVSQLSTNVINEIQISDISSWTELKNKLKLYYSHTKHLAQTHEELETIKQKQNETITEFFKRVEKVKNECIQAETLNCENQNELIGLKKAIQRTALRRFIIHCKPEISQMLRARDIATLNDAFTLALQEEKIINYTKSKSSSNSTSSYSNSNSNSHSTKSNLYCSYCKTHTHTTQNCKKKPNLYNKPHNNFNTNRNRTHTFNNNTASNSQFSNSPRSNEKSCNYCKNLGHTIDECRKRQFNNSRQNTNNNPRVNSLNYEGSVLPQNAPETLEDPIQLAFNDTSS